MSLTPTEQVLVNEALKLIKDGLDALSASSTNMKVKLVVGILESGLAVAEHMIGGG